MSSSQILRILLSIQHVRSSLRCAFKTNTISATPLHFRRSTFFTSFFIHFKRCPLHLYVYVNFLMHPHTPSTSQHPCALALMACVTPRLRVWMVDGLHICHAWSTHLSPIDGTWFLKQHCNISMRASQGFALTSQPRCTISQTQAHNLPNILLREPLFAMQLFWKPKLVQHDELPQFSNTSLASPSASTAPLHTTLL